MIDAAVIDAAVVAEHAEIVRGPCKHRHVGVRLHDGFAGARGDGEGATGRAAAEPAGGKDGLTEQALDRVRQAGLRAAVGASPWRAAIRSTAQPAAPMGSGAAASMGSGTAAASAGLSRRSSSGTAGVWPGPLGRATKFAPRSAAPPSATWG